MQKPQEFEKMIDLTYGVVLLSCLLVATSGYYMFGDDVEDQITISLEKESDNAGILMQGLTWLMICKFLRILFSAIMLSLSTRGQKDTL